jgi:hypothetical protein
MFDQATTFFTRLMTGGPDCRAAIAALQLFVVGDLSRLTGLPSSMLMTGCAFLLAYACTVACTAAWTAGRSLGRLAR